MVFSSTLFLFRFLPIFILFYFAAPGRVKNLILFLASLIFYAWGEPIYVVLLLFSTGMDYIHARALSAIPNPHGRKLILCSSVLINLGVLGFFKYADFLIGSLNAAFGLTIPLFHLPLPIGISFYTFQTMSYTIDCYRGKVQVQKNLLDFGVYVTMFPQLIAGPIVKYAEIERELPVRKVRITDISYGVKRFIFGLAKKVLLAKQMGLLWRDISGRDPSLISPLSAWIGISAFALQIYFDFSGYSDMAIGLGRIMGFHFPENFNYPYISTSITEFWRRWHISLGSWFREYVYIPLGGNRKGLPRQLFNILIVWLLTGIWHGAGWNFLLWGLWFAFWLLMEKIWLSGVLARLPKGIGWLYQIVVVWIGWVFFALEEIGQALSYLPRLFGVGGAGNEGLRALFEVRENIVLFFICAAASLPVGKRIIESLEKSETGLGIGVYRILEKLIPAVLLILSVAYIVDASYNPFLYFRF